MKHFIVEAAYYLAVLLIFVIMTGTAFIAIDSLGFLIGAVLWGLFWFLAGYAACHINWKD